MLVLVVSYTLACIPAISKQHFMYILVGLRNRCVLMLQVFRLDSDCYGPLQNTLSIVRQNRQRAAVDYNAAVLARGA